MKLKKIASLALAGLMAVSMLAGCSGNGGNGAGNGNSGDITAENNTSSVVSAVNNGQSVTNDVKITFTSDASLDAALKKVVELYGDNSLGVNGAGQQTFKNAITSLTGLEEYMPKDLGISDTTTMTTNGFLNGKRGYIKADDTKAVGGKTFTKLYAYAVPALNEQAALNMVASEVDDIVSELSATTYDKNLTVGEHYYDYSYTGTISMVSAQISNGATVYYVAGTISQTVTDQTWEK